MCRNQTTVDEPAKVGYRCIAGTAFVRQCFNRKLPTVVFIH